MHMRLLGRSARAVAVLAPIVIGVLVWASAPASADVALTPISADPFTNTDAQHRTQVEPDTFQFGTTIVSAVQTGRIFGGGSSDIGVATSNDNGVTWTRSFLPGITVNLGGGQFTAGSDPAVAFNRRHNVWL